MEGATLCLHTALKWIYVVEGSPRSATVSEYLKKIVTVIIIMYEVCTAKWALKNFKIHQIHFISFRNFTRIINYLVI